MPPIALVLIIAASVALDQLVKFIVVETMALGQAIEILPFLAFLDQSVAGLLAP